MNRIVFISNSKDFISNAYTEIGRIFDNAEYYAVFISSNYLSLPIKNSFFINSDYPPGLNLETVISLIKQLAPDIIISSSDIDTKSLVAKISASLNTGILSDIESIFIKDGKFFCKKPYIKDLVAVLGIKTKPKIITYITKKTNEENGLSFKPGIIECNDEFDIKKECSICETKELEKLEDASKVIGVGRGVRKEDIGLIKAFAEKIGAVIGYTRPAREKLDMPKEYQIGITGKSISPKLYIALGISGKEYHMKGVEGAEKIIAVNIDPKAPIKNYSDYFINSDYKEFIKKLL